MCPHKDVYFQEQVNGNQLHIGLRNDEISSTRGGTQARQVKGSRVFPRTKVFGFLWPAVHCQFDSWAGSQESDWWLPLMGGARDVPFHNHHGGRSWLSVASFFLRSTQQVLYMAPGTHLLVLVLSWASHRKGAHCEWHRPDSWAV